MRLRIIQTEVNVICRSRRLRRITLTLVWIILDIMRKPNPIIVLLYIQNSDRCKKRFAVKRLVWLTFQTAEGHFCCFVIFAASRWLRHQRPIILLFLDSSVEWFTIFCGNDVTASAHWVLTGERWPIRNKNEFWMYKKSEYFPWSASLMKLSKANSYVRGFESLFVWFITSSAIRDQRGCCKTV